ncbi:hypothetical protein H8E88_35610, partial [candidate division KSB1 bacterium]|nr:hypothetical protein [candidate division KSB1 bacterium]
MKKLNLLLVLLLIVAFSTTLLAEKKYALLKPAKNGVVSEAIPITKKQLDKMLKATPKSNQPEFEASHMGIIDTLTHNWTVNVNWGVAVGDTNASYYNPPASCYIKAIGIVGQDWSGETLATGFNLMIHKPAVEWSWDPADKDGDAWYTKELSTPINTILGDMMWGDFPVSVVDGERVWTEMIYLGYEPDNAGEPFIVSVVPFGDAGGYQGSDGFDPAANDEQRLAKFYQDGRSAGHDPQWIVRDYTMSWQIVVEFYENTPPSLTAEAYGSVLNDDARTFSCAVSDIDANDANQAGAATVTLNYKVNDGDWTDIACALASGTDTDGAWEAVVPAGTLTPGDVIAYKFIGTDKAGLSAESFEYSYGYFTKTANILFYYNDASESVSPADYFNQVEDPYDIWSGIADGPATATLLDMYDNIVRVDGDRPQYLGLDEFSTWLASGTEAAPKCLFWSSQEVWGAETDWVDTEWPVGDWHNDLLGIAAVQNDLSYIATEDYQEKWPINAVMGDMISGNLAQFVADSSWQLYHDTGYELGVTEFSDGFTLAENAVACFTDSATDVPMGLHYATATTKSVFLGFDQLAVNMNAPFGSAGYNWPEYGYPTPGLSIIVPTLEWFGITSDAVENNDAAGVAIKYNLNQNYPNPFNPETQISYSIAK